MTQKRPAEAERSDRRATLTTFLHAVSEGAIQPLDSQPGAIVRLSPAASANKMKMWLRQLIRLGLEEISVETVEQLFVWANKSPPTSTEWAVLIRAVEGAYTPAQVRRELLTVTGRLYGLMHALRTWEELE